VAQGQSDERCGDRSDETATRGDQSLSFVGGGAGGVDGVDEEAPDSLAVDGVDGEAPDSLAAVFVGSVEGLASPLSAGAGFR